LYKPPGSFAKCFPGKTGGQPHSSAFIPEAVQSLRKRPCESRGPLGCTESHRIWGPGEERQLGLWARDLGQMREKPAAFILGQNASVRRKRLSTSRCQFCPAFTWAVPVSGRSSPLGRWEGKAFRHPTLGTRALRHGTDSRALACKGVSAAGSPMLSCDFSRLRLSYVLFQCLCDSGTVRGPGPDTGWRCYIWKRPGRRPPRKDCGA
jgi:hypothetical protein